MVSEFTESGDGRGRATVFVPVTDASADATDVALAWTVSPAPADLPSAFYTTLTASDHDGTVGVTFDFVGLLMYTVYTVSVKLQGLPAPMALVPVVIIILAGGTILTTRVLA